MTAVRNSAIRTADGDHGEPRPAIVRPGHNCWRVDRADRFRCIQDAADYFRWTRDALLGARHSIFIVGWDIQANLDLLPGADPPVTTPPTRLDALLAFVVRRRPQLRCYVLIWDYAALYTLERDPFTVALGLAHASPGAVRLRRPSPGRRLAPPEDRRRRRRGGILWRRRPDRSSLGHVGAPDRGTGQGDGDWHALRPVSRGAGDAERPGRGESRRPGPRPVARPGREPPRGRRSAPSTRCGPTTPSPICPTSRWPSRARCRPPNEDPASGSASVVPRLDRGGANATIYIESQYFTNACWVRHWPTAFVSPTDPS